MSNASVPSPSQEQTTLSCPEGLSEAHYQELTEGSAISDLRVRQRYYQTITDPSRLPAEFADYQRRPGLLIPIYSVRGHIESFQLKPDTPRIGKNGKPIKYETAANAPQIIDCPPSVIPHLANPKTALVITEGAKKVDSAICNDMPCTIGLQGVFGWRGKNDQGGTTALADWEHIALNNRLVILGFDSDVMSKESVRSALDRLANFLTRKGATVQYMLMPDLDDGSKCGIDDWYASGRDRDALARCVVENLPPLTAPKSPTTVATIPRLVTRTMREVEKHEINWLWPGWLPKGMLTLLGGYAGDGKSTLTAALAAAFSKGGELPDGQIAPITNTLLVLTEDDVSHVVKDRLEIHGLDDLRVHTLDHMDAGDGNTRLFNLRTDVPALRQKVEQDNIGLIVLDPLSGVLNHGDRNNEGEVRDTFAPLIKMMEETGVAVIGIMHIGKNDGQQKAFQKLMGSTAFTALARSVWMVSELPEEFQAEGEPTRKLLGVAKSNYAIAPAPVQFCRPLDAALQYMGQSPISLDQAFSWKPKQEKEPTEGEKAEAWLTQFMDGKQVLASDVESAAKQEGYGITTLRNVKKKLGITSTRQENKWYWYPPEGESVNAA